ncbi:bifunctional tetrahydrofolate synthase/dihydrofolate synthase [Xanthomonas citri pv. fuscans CFBP 6996]|uniref:bifunctional tetrahydrofolate synthase/dihydrofolate synthase n=1 Tax=Xanthomonas citri TaxID=346 RepID=UPI000C179064|nr:bifunctional tetrahydrofolate synthase/dihydrofolate synthase [Xanthomonas citri]ATS50758.1 bifunctional tetrahydrofolate synthase/dihydrofolate synthase [Xanthomonas citri pv. phaseoli var. fuscans]ATS56493.1 bifunctional tetrahydrofolate synthase/dihydrofolate synthase [Xanthomonas citri pv. phaseoli var. fuscans]ATS59499.1 bifunctional tetrahydrofolate synthase/dihydrofolate synthase [Xanthomonas citri pv. phaseoli var. fuscans]PTY31432.1 bifunctional tetrahydrofolate synthase/dihydrofola
MNATDSLSAWLAYIEQQHPNAIAMGLERVREVAARLQIAAPAKHVIVVGGTNGKGSTVAFIEAIGRAAGWKVGAYTSPHLLRYNERVRIDGNEASDAQLVDAFAAVEAARGDTALTYFEFGTLAALWLFQQSALDLAVLEIGLGGRLDAVNIVDSDVAVITTVDLDHTDWLGDDREAIGTEKAGIIRAWKPVVLGEIDPPSSVLRRAYQLGANAIRAGSDYFFEPIDAPHAEAPQSDAPHWRWRDVAVTLELPMPALHAPVQLANAAAAIAALQALPVEVPDAAWAQGIANAQVAGRLQRLEVDGVQVLLDVGHNPQAARALAAALGTQAHAGSTHAIYAALADKDVLGVVEAVAGQIDHWALAGLEGARGQSAQALQARLQGSAAAQAPCHRDVAGAVRAVLDAASPGDRVLIFGSFHTVADALGALRSAR